MLYHVIVFYIMNVLLLLLHTPMVIEYVHKTTSDCSTFSQLLTIGQNVCSNTATILDLERDSIQYSEHLNKLHKKDNMNSFSLGCQRWRSFLKGRE